MARSKREARDGRHLFCHAVTPNDPGYAARSVESHDNMLPSLDPTKGVGNVGHPRDDQAALVVRQSHHGEISLRQVLLIGDILVVGDENRETVSLDRVEKLPVRE